MAQILRFIRRCNVFEPDVTLAMGDAYDKAMATISTEAQSQFSGVDRQAHNSDGTERCG